jgi:hypothetical protein
MDRYGVKWPTKKEIARVYMTTTVLEDIALMEVIILNKLLSFN